MLAALNGVLGDRLQLTGNALAQPMLLRHGGQTLALNPPSALATSLGGQVGPHLLLLVHGLCMPDAPWRRDGHDHGAFLADALGCTPVYLRYNSGQHTSTNGRELASLRDLLLATTPFTAPFTRLGQLRSAGITDLRHGHVQDADRQGRDRFTATEDHRVPLPLRSALGQHDEPSRQLAFAPDRQLIVWRTSHLDLLSSRPVAERLQAWLATDCRPT